jgi:heme oxygenase
MVDVILKYFHLIKVITAFKPSEYSKSIRLATKKKHDKIEAHPFIKRLINGTLTDKEYYYYLKNIIYIYREIEQNFFSDLKSMDLLQTSRILTDINNYKELLNIENTDSDKEGYFYNDWLSLIKSKPKYFRKTDLYLMWLADMYGGQILKRKVRFNSALQFKDIRRKIKKIRTFIELGLNESNIYHFINHINNSYDEQYNMVDKIDKYING